MKIERDRIERDREIREIERERQGEDREREGEDAIMNASLIICLHSKTKIFKALTLFQVMSVGSQKS